MKSKINKIQLSILMYLVYGFVLLLLVGCKSTNLPPDTNNTNTTTTITEVVHDTIFRVEKDSSYYQALLECQGNKVVIKKPPVIRHSRSILPPKVSITENNVLEVDCETKAQELFAEWKSKHTTKEKQTTITRHIRVPRELNFFQKSQIWLGRIFLMVLLGLAGWGLLKLKNFIL